MNIQLTVYGLGGDYHQLRAELDEMREAMAMGKPVKPIQPKPTPVTPAPATPPANSPHVKPKNLVRSLNFFGDSTNARIGEQAIALAKKDNIPVINNAQGGSLASYALMSMNGSPVDIVFDVSTLPARANGAMVDGKLVYHEGTVPFSMHSTLAVIDEKITAAISGQTPNVKVIPHDEYTHNVTPGKRYPVRLKNSGGEDGICVLATAKNDINGANIGNWQTVLERVKMYVEKCINQIQPKESPRFIVLPIWADNKPGWSKEVHGYRWELKDQFNNWLREKYGNNVWDIEEYMTSDQIWTDTGVTPNEADKQAQKDKVMPLSLSHDGGAHFLPAVETVIAGKIIQKAKDLGYL